MAAPNNGPRHRLLRRHSDNPILTAEHWPYFVNTVFNAAATRLPSGETLLLCRVEDCSGRSHLTVARSDDGVTGWRIDQAPALNGNPNAHPEEVWGLEDPRVVWVPELKQYGITYTSYGRGGPGVSLALTADFKTFDRVGQIMPPENKDAALFPCRFNGRWALLHRPVPSWGSGANMWISFSPDLRHWGDHTVLIEARRGAWWDAGKIGLSPPPIETPDGWLVMYHGVRRTAAGCLYRLGLALLDREDPRQCLLRSTKWMFSPETDYERSGDVGDVVFPCGFTIADDNDTILLYYGAADTSIALATGSISEMLAWLKENGEPGGRAAD